MYCKSYHQWRHHDVDWLDMSSLLSDGVPDAVTGVGHAYEGLRFAEMLIRIWPSVVDVLEFPTQISARRTLFPVDSE